MRCQYGRLYVYTYTGGADIARLLSTQPFVSGMVTVLPESVRQGQDHRVAWVLPVFLVRVCVAQQELLMLQAPGTLLGIIVSAVKAAAAAAPVSSASCSGRAALWGALQPV